MGHQHTGHVFFCSQHAQGCKGALSTPRHSCVISDLCLCPVGHQRVYFMHLHRHHLMLKQCEPTHHPLKTS